MDSKHSLSEEVQSLAHDFNAMRDTVDALSHAIEVVDEIAPTQPPVPPGRHVELEGRGTTFIRERFNHADGKTLFLLHGWTATADLNWFTSYDALAEHFNIVALDHRGHGRGIRSDEEFTLEQCADDVVALADHLGIDVFTVVGYSMGGAIAQLVAKRHPDHVEALVLGATASYFADTRAERFSFMGLSGLATLAKYTPAQARQWITEHAYLNRKAEGWHPWAIEEASRHDWRMILEAGSAIGEFDSRPWLHELDLPASVLVTMSDNVVPTKRQIKLFEALPQAEAFRSDGNHDAVVEHQHSFVPALVRACQSALARV